MLIEVSFFIISIILKFLIGACFITELPICPWVGSLKFKIKRHLTVIGHLKNIEQN